CTIAREYDAVLRQSSRRAQEQRLFCLSQTGQRTEMPRWGMVIGRILKAPFLVFPTRQNPQDHAGDISLRDWLETASKIERDSFSFPRFPLRFPPALGRACPECSQRLSGLGMLR